MSPEDIRLVVAAVSGIALSILLITKGRLHPFVGLLCGAFLVGPLAGIPLAETAKAVEQGAGSILGGTGLVVALGLSLGAMLQISNGASALAMGALRFTSNRTAPWVSLFVALLIGLPLFFETGLVLLLPIVAAVAVNLGKAKGGGGSSDAAKLQLLLPALAGLSIAHALVPPHPGPLLAVDALDANLARTMFYGLMVAIPTGIVSGPLLARVIGKNIPIHLPEFEPPSEASGAPSKTAALVVVLLPVLLIALGQFIPLLPEAVAAHFVWLKAASNPVLALLIANLVALPLLFGRRIGDAVLQDSIWTEAVAPAGAILLAIGAGGSLKQVLVEAGLSDLLARLATAEVISPLLLAWLIAVGVRLATGSATVATITTAGVVPGLVAASGVSPEWVVLAIGCGSVFFSHVNDPGFWLVRGYLGTSTADTFRTWSVLETVISVAGLVFVMLGSYLL
ncbi:MAG TPA: gluconate:H+ symporter [Sphingobium sp.]|nr:gluconate:H+ symporter [Sphingobium sp.]